MMVRLTDVSKLTRDRVVPYYIDLICMNRTDEEVIRVNQLILSKWKPSGLIYIKEKAWRYVEQARVLLNYLSKFSS